MAFHASLTENPSDVIARRRSEDGVLLARSPPAPMGKRVSPGVAGMGAADGTAGRVGRAHLEHQSRGEGHGLATASAFTAVDG